jgi:hypothetical protein
MQVSKQRSIYESSLARAHKALHHAADAAAQLGDSGAESDIYDLQHEILRMTESSLKGKKWKKRQLEGQQEFPIPS